MSDHFIGVDSGTQGCKAILVNGKTGAILAEATAGHVMKKPDQPGAREQDPKTWVAAMEKTIKAVLRKASVAPASIKAMAVSGQQHGLVVLDEQEQVIRPAKLWCDTSTAPQAELLVKKLGGLKKCVHLTGNGIPPGFTASKLVWLKQVEPKNYERIATILLPHDYLNFHLTGKKTMEAGDASGTGFFDTKTRDWHPRVLAAMDPTLREKLPEVQSSSEPVGTLLPMVAKRLGLNPDTLVAAGGGDNMMSAIGTGNTKAGMVTASLGTSGTIFAYSSRPVVDSDGEIAAFCDSTGGWLPLTCTMNVTVSSELVKECFSWDNKRLEQEVSSIAPGSDGISVLPYFTGERTPNLPHARGVIYGLTERNFTMGHIARAAMEGVVFGLNYGLERMKDLGVRPKQVRVTGGGANSPSWRQMLADAFESEVIGLTTSEGAALGAALQALWCYRLTQGDRVRIAHITDALIKTDAKTRARPTESTSQLYRTAQDLHNQLSRANQPVFELSR